LGRLLKCSQQTNVDLDQRARYLGQTNGFGIFGIVEKVIGKADGAI